MTYEDFSVIGDINERARVVHLAERMEEIDGSTSKMSMISLVADQEGMPRKTIERLFYAWRKKGVMALVDKRKISFGKSENSIMATFKSYAEKDRNTSKGGWEQMMRDFRSGKVFEFGTWRDVWKENFPYEPIPQSCPIRWIPKGWGYANLMRHYQKDSSRLMSLAWNRQGQFAASRYTQDVLRSRLDADGKNLPVGAVYQADDVWHNIDVVASGMQGTYQPLEFAFYDVASAYKHGSFMKPRTFSVDPKTGRMKGDNLNEFQFRTAFAYICCVTGFHRDGVRFILERGTTAIRENVRRQIAGIPYYGRLISIETSGIMNTPAHKGMFIGNAGGNPRFKALTEGAHNILHNATASLPGNRGRDAAHMHESRAALVKYAGDLMANVADINSPALSLLDLPLLTFDQYRQAFMCIEDEVMSRTDHKLEGWINNEVTEYRLNEYSNDWVDASRMLAMSDAERAATNALIKTNPASLVRRRKMSRKEVWEQGQSDLVRVPLHEMVNFLDVRDARDLIVRDDRTISLRDNVYYPGREMRYRAIVKTRHGYPEELVPGTKVKVFFNPWGELAKTVWICSVDGEYLGMAPQVEVAHWSDPDSIRAAAGRKLSDIAAHTADMRGRHIDDAAHTLARKAWNNVVISHAKKGALQAPQFAAVAGVSMEDLTASDDVFSSVSSSPKIELSLEQLSSL